MMLDIIKPWNQRFIRTTATRVRRIPTRFTFETFSLNRIIAEMVIRSKEPALLTGNTIAPGNVVRANSMNLLEATLKTPTPNPNTPSVLAIASRFLQAKGDTSIAADVKTVKKKKFFCTSNPVWTRILEDNWLNPTTMIVTIIIWDNLTV